MNLAVDCITAEATLAAIAKVISPSGTVGILLPIKEGSNVRGEEGTQMHMEIPEDKNPFSKGTNIVGVRTFNYQEVSTSVSTRAMQRAKSDYRTNI